MQKESAPQDWDRHDIVCALHKKGVTLNSLSMQNGLDISTISKALQYPYPKAERVIAEALGVPPETIWPTRYQQREERKARAQYKADRSRRATAKPAKLLDGITK